MFLIEVYLNKNIWRRGILPSRKVGQVWRVYKPDPAGGGYITRFARPAISGNCALWRSDFPDLRPFEVKSMLLE
jgi:hypothetical protein